MNDWFRLSGKVGRKEFIFRVLVIITGVTLVYNLIRIYLLSTDATIARLISLSVSQLTIVILCMPSIIKRTRDINKNTQSSLIFIIAWFFGLPNYAIYALIFTDNGFIPATATAPGFITNIVAFIFFFFLVFKRPVTNN